LKTLGAALTAICRKGDIVYRFGGDEFAILLKDIQADDVALQKARGILDAVMKFDFGGNEPLSCSIGICFCDRETAFSDELMRRADAALYRAKRLGKNRFEVWLDKANLLEA